LPLAYRKKQLQRLYDLVKENEALLLKALHKDLRKHAVESIGAEIAPVTEECLWFLEVHYPGLKHFDVM
jgi:acyl-CoA reductase-like NAD-dependent aldehyde dehydrogenase